MEILHGNSDKRRIILALSEGGDVDAICKGLEQDYLLVRCENANEALAIMNEQFNDLSAALIDEGIAGCDDFAFLRAVTEEHAFDTIPVIVVARGDLKGETPDFFDRCYHEGAVDVIELPRDMTIAHHRIDNAIQLRRSATFYEIESMLRRLPSMIFLKDTECRYVFSTQYWHHLEMGDDPKWTIRGKTDLDIRKDRANALAAIEADKEIIRTGKGTSYTIEIDVDGILDYVQLIKEPVFDDQGNVTGIIALGNNVTESELMKRELAQYAIKDGLTGLGNRRAFDEFVESIPERDAYPIAVISADCDNLKLVNDAYGHLVGDEYLHMTAVVLRAGVPDEEFVYRVGGDEFAAFALNTTLEQAEEMVSSMRRKAELFKLSHGEVVVSYGIAMINGPEDDTREVIDLADFRMYEEKAARKAKYCLIPRSHK